MDGKTQAPAVDNTQWLPTLNVFNNYGLITSADQKKAQTNLWG
jgi:hypothetical protein